MYEAQVGLLDQFDNSLQDWQKVIYIDILAQVKMAFLVMMEQRVYLALKVYLDL